MQRVRLIHWNGPEGRELRRRIEALGFEASFDDLEPGVLAKLLRSGLPDAFVIDLSRLPSHGRQVAFGIRAAKTTRTIPIVFLDGDPEKVAKLREMLPDATYTTWPKLNAALTKAIGKPLKAPIVPPSSIYTGKPTVEKLGVKAGMRVAVLGAPKGFAEVLKPLPPKVKLTATADAANDLYICVVRSQRELAVQLATVTRAVDRQTLWMVWPKQASGVRTDLNGNIIRESGLASGWVDFKICSLDDTWSGLAFKRRR